jgi:hypothetical protein
MQIAAAWTTTDTLREIPILRRQKEDTIMDLNRTGSII